MSETRGKILIVDDEPQIRKILKTTLTRRLGLDVMEAPSGEDALQILEHHTPHVVILDYNMPGLNGLETLKEIKKRNELIQIIFLTARAEEAPLAGVLNAGADDYILKRPGNTQEILARVATHLRIYKLNKKLETANRRLAELIEIDDLTGLYNMRSVYDRIDDALEKARNAGDSVSVVMMDMDHFKTVNDGHDHLFGSFVLKEMGRLITETLGGLGFGARFGGDEFMLVFPKIDAKDVEELCDKLRIKVKNHLFKSGPDEMQLTVSVGFAVTRKNPGEINSQDIVRLADRALYDSKEAGRDRVSGFDQLKDQEIFTETMNHGKLQRHTIE